MNFKKRNVKAAPFDFRNYSGHLTIIEAAYEDEFYSKFWILTGSINDIDQQTHKITIHEMYNIKADKWIPIMQVVNLQQHRCENLKSSKMYSTA